MSEIIDQFCESYFEVNHLTHDRRVQIRRQLTEFEAALGKPLLEATAIDFERHLSQRLQSFTPATVKKQQYQIRPFFTWARRHNLIEQEQWRALTDVPCPRGAKQGAPRPFTRDEMRRLWAILERRYPFAEDAEHWCERYFEGKSPWGRVRRHGERLQYEAMIACALYGGLRRGEIFRLQLDDLEHHHSVLPARSRKNRDGSWVERKIPIIEPMRTAFDAWYEFRTNLQPQVSADPEQPWIRLQRTDFGIWLCHHNREGEGMKHLARLGDDGNLRWGFHRLRHTCATEMLRNGYKLHIVRKILGHSTLEQTLRYAELLEGDVLDESDRVGGRFAAAIARTRNGHGA